MSSSDLRQAIVKKLKSASSKERFRTIHFSVVTVGHLLRLPVTLLMKILDPLLTYGEKKIGLADVHMEIPRSFWLFRTSLIFLPSS